MKLLKSQDTTQPQTSRPARHSFPLITMSLSLLAIAIYFLPGCAAALEYSGVPGSRWQLWRLFSSHLTHFNLSHLIWDLLAFMTLGSLCEMAHRRRFLWTMLISALAIPLAVMTFLPAMDSYRGLSGIDSALFVLLVAGVLKARLQDRCYPAMLVAGATLLLLAGKILFEMITGDTLFVSSNDAGFVPVPLAHAIGGMCGLILAMFDRKWIELFRKARPLRAMEMFSLAGLLLCSGCNPWFPISSKVREVGIRRELPVVRSSESGPVLEAYSSSDRKRLAVKYQVLVNGKPTERWMRFTVKGITRRLPSTYQNQDKFDGPVMFRKKGNTCFYYVRADYARRHVSSRPRCRPQEMTPLEVYHLANELELNEGPVAGIHYNQISEEWLEEQYSGKRKPVHPKYLQAPRLYAFIDVPQTKERDVLVVSFPQRTYRSVGGKFAQLLLPVTVATDLTVVKAGQVTVIAVAVPLVPIALMTMM
jgi:rhomboid family GlyGly-CTERM serine protease